jgi:hypothetical protein
MTEAEFKKQIVDVSSEMVQHLYKFKKLKESFEELSALHDQFDQSTKDSIKNDEEFLFRFENRKNAISRLFEELDF